MAPAVTREEAEARLTQLTEDYAAEVRRVYAESETRMLEKVARRIERGIDVSDGKGWAEKKLAEVQAMNREIRQEVADLRKLDPKIAQAVEAAYRAGADAAIADLIAANLTDLAADMSLTRGAALRTLVSALTDSLGSTHLRILRTAKDAYRSVVAQASEQALAGTVTRRQAAQIALNRLADQGVTGFIDSAGRSWDMASYVEMATRSTCNQAAIQGHSDKLEANGKDLVIISDSPAECSWCRPFEGKVLSLSGNDPDHPPLSEAIAAGLYHAACTHRQHLFTEGLTRPYTDTENPEGYEERQKQRYYERGIRQWKRREAVGIEPADKLKATAKRKEWQAKQKQFIEETGRRRDYGRESITRAR